MILICCSAGISDASSDDPAGYSLSFKMNATRSADCGGLSVPTRSAGIVVWIFSNSSAAVRPLHAALEVVALQRRREIGAGQPLAVARDAARLRELLPARALRIGIDAVPYGLARLRAEGRRVDRSRREHGRCCYHISVA